MKIKDLIHEMFSSGNLNLEVPINDTKDFDGNYVELPIDTSILNNKKKKIKMHRRPSTKVLILGDLMKLKDLNESIENLERLDEFNLSILSDIADKVSQKISAIYYNDIKGRQTPAAQSAFRKLEKKLANSILDKDWADEIFKDFDHTKVDLTVDEINYYIAQVDEADAYLRAKRAAEIAKQSKRNKAEKLLQQAISEFERLESLQLKTKTFGKLAKSRQIKIDKLSNDIEKLKASLSE